MTVFKPQIQQQYIDRFRLHSLERRGAARNVPDQLQRGLHPDQLAQHDNEIEVVVGNQHAAAARSRGHEGLGCTVEDLRA